MELNNDLKENADGNFRLPRWNEIPDIDLYIDQVVSYLENYLSNYIKNENEKKLDKIITKTMINNYVKHEVIKPPVNKKYSREHIAYLFVIFILKQNYSMDEIKKLITLALDTSSIKDAYNRFCSEVEKAIKMTFTRNNYLNSTNLSEEQYILRNVVQSFANKLYVQKIFLTKEEKNLKNN